MWRGLRPWQRSRGWVPGSASCLDCPTAKSSRGPRGLVLAEQLAQLAFGRLQGLALRDRQARARGVDIRRHLHALRRLPHGTLATAFLVTEGQLVDSNTLAACSTLEAIMVLGRVSWSGSSPDSTAASPSMARGAPRRGGTVGRTDA